MKFRVLLLPGAVCVYFFPSWPPSRCRVMKGEPFIITDWRKAYSCYLNLLILTSGVYLACEYVCMFLCRFKGGCLFQLASAGAPSLAALNCMIDCFVLFFKICRSLSVSASNLLRIFEDRWSLVFDDCISRRSRNPVVAPRQPPAG